MLFSLVVKKFLLLSLLKNINMEVVFMYLLQAPMELMGRLSVSIAWYGFTIWRSVLPSLVVSYSMLVGNSFLQSDLLHFFFSF